MFRYIINSKIMNVYNDGKRVIQIGKANSPNINDFNTNPSFQYNFSNLYYSDLKLLAVIETAS